MPSNDPDSRSSVARLAALRRHGYIDSDTEVIDARRSLKTAQLAAHIRRVVDTAPPLSDTQRERLAALLRGGAA